MLETVFSLVESHRLVGWSIKRKRFAIFVVVGESFIFLEFILRKGFNFLQLFAFFFVFCKCCNENSCATSVLVYHSYFVPCWPLLVLSVVKIQYCIKKLLHCSSIWCTIVRHSWESNFELVKLQDSVMHLLHSNVYICKPYDACLFIFVLSHCSLQDTATRSMKSKKAEGWEEMHLPIFLKINRWSISSREVLKL